MTVDGPKGVGKSAVVDEVADLIEASDGQALVTSEPSKTPLGNLLRVSTERYRGYSFAHLMAGDRLDHVGTTVLPAVQAGITVVCDRYVASSLVSQRLDGMLLEETWNINQPLLLPSLSVVLTGTAEVIAERLTKRGYRSARYALTDGSTAREIHFFAEAAHFMRCQGVHVVTIDCTELTVSQVAAHIVQEIDSMQMAEGLTRS